jgi:hypothetical protein
VIITGNLDQFLREMKPGQPTKRQLLSIVSSDPGRLFKRARWRRLWRQQIQDYLIAAIQNVRILLANQNPKKSAAAALSSLILRTKMPTLLHC